MLEEGVGRGGGGDDLGKHAKRRGTPGSRWGAPLCLILG